VELSANGTQKGFDKTNAVIAAVVALISFIIYRLTVAQTLSFWDCGEFIASSHILGNPHPPGSPLFIVVGRFFDLIPWASDVAFRINLFSVFCSTVAAVFAYLIIVRLVTSWYISNGAYKLGRLIAYASGFIGSLFVAFGQTNWNNSVETEVYGLAMAMMLIMLWLGFKWFDHRYTPAGQRIILLVAFLAMLSVGVHLTVFVVIPIVAIFFSLKREATATDWGLVAGFFIFELALIFMLSRGFSYYSMFMALSAIAFVALMFYLRQKIYWPILLSFGALSPIMISFYPFLYSLIAWSIICAVIWFVKRDSLWRLATFIMIAGAIGFSIHTFIPIRSAQHPVIDENTPSRNFKTFVDFLDRAQYGSMSMTKRMFVRRGAWENQFGDHARMGLMRFFKGQYSNKSLFPLFFLIGIYGLLMLAKRTPSWGYILIAFVLITTVGLVLYMNFADGTHYNTATGDAYQEVRDRDYFFTPGFILFGMAIGLGMGAIMETVRTATLKFGESRNRLAVMASLVLVLTPIVPVHANYFTNDRSKNRMAYDYAYNLLNSCDKDAILFTSGDNDTFPVWCVQEIYGIRKDIRVVNFSLLNTDWYSWQLSNVDLLSAVNAGYDIDSLARAADAAGATVSSEMVAPTEIATPAIGSKARALLESLADRDALPRGIIKRVPVSLTDDQILWEDTVVQGQEMARPAKPYYDPVRRRPTYLLPTYYNDQPLRVATLMMENIILTNRWKYPVYFSAASGDVRETPLNLLERLERVGMVLKLSREKAGMGYLDQTSDSLFFKLYKYTNLADTMVAQDENATGIVLTYPEKMLDYQSWVYRGGDTARSDLIIDRICGEIPTYWRSRLSQRDMYYRKGDSAKGKEIQDEMLTYLHGYLNKNPENIFFSQFLGMIYMTLNDDQKAEQYLTQAWEMNHDKEQTFRALLALYAQMRRPNDMLRVAQEYRAYHADDPIANDVIRNAQMLMQGQGLPPVSSPPVRVTPSPSPTSTPPVRVMPPPQSTQPAGDSG